MPYKKSKGLKMKTPNEWLGEVSDNPYLTQSHVERMIDIIRLQNEALQFYKSINPDVLELINPNQCAIDALSKTQEIINGESV